MPAKTPPAESPAELTEQQKTILNTYPIMATATDAGGTERVVVPNIEAGWKPSAIEPDKDEVTRLENAQKLLELRTAENQKLLAG